METTGIIVPLNLPVETTGISMQLASLTLRFSSSLSLLELLLIDTQVML